MLWVQIIIAAELLILLYWVGAIFYAIQRGFGEVIKGLESVDGRLSSRDKK